MHLFFKLKMCNLVNSGTDTYFKNENSLRYFIKLIVFSVILLSQLSDGSKCDKKPTGVSLPPSKNDGRFQLRMVQETHSKYMHDQQYTIELAAVNKPKEKNPFLFTHFMITAESEDESAKDIRPGRLIPSSEITSMYSTTCPNALVQTNAAPKDNVQVYWQSPPANAGCVLLRATVRQTEETWFMEDEDSLTVKLCEEDQRDGDSSPQINRDCTASDEAKYEVQLVRIWSRNIHPLNYPNDEFSAVFSDMVGASHKLEHDLWAPDSKASDGLALLARTGNTSLFEKEIIELGDNVHTIIKGKAHGHLQKDKPTYALLRVDKDYHLVSLAMAIRPSPDWFLGVSKYELCTMSNEWLPSSKINLYPWDAGVDNGISYESTKANEYPAGIIDRVKVGSFDPISPFYKMNLKDLRPFAELHFTLIRTFPKPSDEKEEEATVPEDEEVVAPEATDDEGVNEPEEPSRYRTSDLVSESLVGESQPKVVVEAKGCPLTEWEEWQPCSEPCTGTQIRSRYHVVNGKPYKYYAGSSNLPEPSHECQLQDFELFQARPCSCDPQSERRLPEKKKTPRNDV